MSKDQQNKKQHNKRRCILKKHLKVNPYNSYNKDTTQPWDTTKINKSEPLKSKPTPKSTLKPHTTLSMVTIH